MKSSPRRPLILKRRKLPLAHSDTSSTLARDELNEQSNGSHSQEQARMDEQTTNQEQPGTQEVPAAIKIIDHPTMLDTQMVIIPASTDIRSTLETLTAKGKLSGNNGPTKFILLSSGRNSGSTETKAFKHLLQSKDEPCNEPCTVSNSAQEEEKNIEESTETTEESTFGMPELQCMGASEQEENSSGEIASCSLDSSLTNIQWLGKMSSSGLSPCSVKKETEKENQTPKQEIIKLEEISAASSSATSITERPPYSYMAMIQFAINSTEKRRMTLKDIYTWIEDHFPYFKHIAKPGWKNSIRHNLSLHDMFVREMSANGKISFWTINPDANRYLTLDQVFKPLDVGSPASVEHLESQQKRHTPDLQKNVGRTSGSKVEPPIARRKMKLLLPRVNSYLVPIQFPVSQSLILQPSSKVSLPAAQGASISHSETLQSSKRVRIAPKVLPSNDEPGLLPPAVPIKEETYVGEESSLSTPQRSMMEDVYQGNRESFPASLSIKNESDNSYSSDWASSFLPALPIKEEIVQPGEEPNLVLPLPLAKQKSHYTILKSPPRGVLDTLVIKRRDRREMGRSRRKQHLSLPRPEEPVLLLPPSGSSDPFPLENDLPFGKETRPLGNASHRSNFQGENGPFKTPIKEKFYKLPVSSTPNKTATTTSPLAAIEPWRSAPSVKETSELDFSPLRTSPVHLLSLQENLDLLGFSSTPLRHSPFDSPQPPLLNTGVNAMVSGPLTSSPASSRQSSPDLQTSVLPENRSFLEGLVLDTMNDSLSKILLDVTFPGLEDDNLATDFNWSQYIPELK